MKIYLAGPMRGLPEFNFPAFHRYAAQLRAEGHTVFSPAEKDIERAGGVDISRGNATGSLAQLEKQHGFSARVAIADDLDFICRHAEGIAMMPGWQNSKGATLEHLAAQFCGIEIILLKPLT